MLWLKQHSLLHSACLLPFPSELSFLPHVLCSTNTNLLSVPRVTFASRGFSVAVWNSLPSVIRHSSSTHTFSVAFLKLTASSRLSAPLAARPTASELAPADITHCKGLLTYLIKQLRTDSVVSYAISAVLTISATGLWPTNRPTHVQKTESESN